MTSASKMPLTATEFDTNATFPVVADRLVEPMILGDIGKDAPVYPPEANRMT
jgi:hypothetical protein